MTAQRQERYGWRLGLAAFGLIASFFVALSLDFAAQAATTERVVVNRYSGLAIEGFDPVAYFTESRPARGIRISKLAKRAPSGASATRATVPPLSRIRKSTDPSSAATIRSISGRGVTFAGSPRFWAIANQRLYLFGREENRDAFTANPAAFLKDAAVRWPALEQGLAQ